MPNYVSEVPMPEQNWKQAPTITMCSSPPTRAPHCGWHRGLPPSSPAALAPGLPLTSSEIHSSRRPD